MAVVILVVLSLGLVAAIVDRVADREVVGVVFILAMNVGHWCMTVALARDDVGGLPRGLRGADARRRPGEARLPRAAPASPCATVPRGVVYGLTGAYAVAYAVLILLAAAI